MSLQSFGFFGFLLVVAVVYLHLPQRLQSVFLLGPAGYSTRWPRWPCQPCRPCCP